jgi:FkbM family methyltransferase
MIISDSLRKLFLAHRIEKFQLPSEFEAFISGLNESEIYQMASLVAPKIRLRLYPGWYFGASINHPEDKRTLLRIAIWRYCRGHRLTKPLVLSWYHGLRVRAYLGNDTSRLLFIDGYYEPNEFYFLSSVLKPGMIFLDAGANDGLYSLFASRYVTNRGCVIACEPSQREFDRFQANIKLNGTWNIRSRQVALYNTNGKRMLRVAGYEHEGHNTLGDFIYEGVERIRMENVPVKRLDDLLIEEEISHMDVIKMDVEGAEHAILEGAVRTLRIQKPLILLELSDAALKNQGSSATETICFLKNLGYFIYSFSPTSGRLIKALKDTDLKSNIVASPSAQFIG